MNSLFMFFLFFFLLSLTACSNKVSDLSPKNTLSNHEITVKKASIPENLKNNAEWILVDGKVVGIEIDGQFYQIPKLEAQDTHYF